jgi:hypothetical protein
MSHVRRDVLEANFIIQGERVHSVYRLLSAAKAGYRRARERERWGREGGENRWISSVHFRALISRRFVSACTLVRRDYDTRGVRSVIVIHSLFRTAIPDTVALAQSRTRKRRRFSASAVPGFGRLARDRSRNFRHRRNRVNRDDRAIRAQSCQSRPS